MKRTLLLGSVLAAVSLALASSSPAQGLPTKQPKYVTIIREEVKAGRAAEHAKHEAGWPAALEKAKSPDYYVALTSMTGPLEAWYIIPSESFAQVAASMKREDSDPVLSAELARLTHGDAEYIHRSTTLHAMARPELGMGEFPDMAKARFFSVGMYRTHPGKEAVFEEIAKTYAAARKRAAPKTSARVYELLAGAPGPMFIVITSVEDYAQLDQQMSDSMATFEKATPEDRAVFARWGEAVAGEETQRFRVDPVQSYVPRAVREKDPAFWLPK